jgi:hypothetical protein
VTGFTNFEFGLSDAQGSFRPQEVVGFSRSN